MAKRKSRFVKTRWALLVGFAVFLGWQLFGGLFRNYELPTAAEESAPQTSVAVEMSPAADPLMIVGGASVASSVSPVTLATVEAGAVPPSFDETAPVVSTVSAPSTANVPPPAADPVVAMVMQFESIYHSRLYTQTAEDKIAEFRACNCVTASLLDSLATMLAANDASAQWIANQASQTSVVGQVLDPQDVNKSQFDAVVVYTGDGVDTAHTSPVTITATVLVATTPKDKPPAYESVNDQLRLSQVEGVWLIDSLPVPAR